MDFTELHQQVSSRVFPSDTFAASEALAIEHLGHADNLGTGNRANLITIFRFLIATRGSKFVERMLLSLLRKGLSGDSATAIALHSFRYTGDYAGAAHTIGLIQKRAGTTPYSSYLHGESLAADGQFEAFERRATSAARELKRKRSKSYSPSPAQWTRLSLDFGFPQVADLFLPLISEPDELQPLRSRRATYTGQAIDLPARMINLPQDTRKWDLSGSSFRRTGFNNLERTDAFLGKSLPRSAALMLTDQTEAGRNLPQGALGCWLSHWSLWEKIADSTEDWVLVLEDDAFPFGGAPLVEETLEILSDSDFAWANSRMAGIHRQNHYEWKQDLVDVWSQMTTWDSRRKGFGTDAYLMRPRAAQYFLDQVSKEKIIGHVDGQMATHTFTANSQPETSIQGQSLRRQRRAGIEPSLNATTLQLPLASDNAFGVSSTVFG